MSSLDVTICHLPFAFRGALISHIKLIHVTVPIFWPRPGTTGTTGTMGTTGGTTGAVPQRQVPG